MLRLLNDFSLREGREHLLAFQRTFMQITRGIPIFFEWALRVEQDQYFLREMIVIMQKLYFKDR